ncbi:hypothetical protein KY284_020882 [Solanum tuberosum]|nr:hypothetical protein KY284_020882 [Solanum tuberosum]
MDLFSRKYARLLIIGIGLMALVQLGGNNAITSFASSFFRAAGIHLKVKIILQGCSADSASQVMVVLQSRVLSLQKKLDDDFLCWDCCSASILLCQTSSKPSSIQRSDAIVPKITAIPLPATCTMDISPSHSDILVSMDESMDTMRSLFNIYSFLFILWIWRNLDKIDNIQQLRKLEDSISKSLNEIAKHKGQEKKGDIELKFFEFHDLKVMTDIFSPNNKLGEGVFGTVFKVLFLQPGYLQVCNTKYALTPKENGKKSLRKEPDRLIAKWAANSCEKAINSKARLM